MKLSLTGRQARNIGVSMISARVFLALSVDGPHYMNSGWLCALCGCLIALPAAFAIDRAVKRDIDKSSLLFRFIGILIFIYSAYQAAVIAGLLIDSISYSNLKTLPPMILLIAMLLGCFYVIMKNGSGIGNASKLWGLIFGILFAAMLLANYRNLRVHWLTPLLGPGISELAYGSINAASCIISGALLHLQVDPNAKENSGCISTVLIGSLIAAATCAYRSAMIPVQPVVSMDRLTGIASLLSNGRTSLAVQLPMNLIWFFAFTVSLFGYSFAGTFFLQDISPKIKLPVYAVTTLALIYVFSSAGIAESDNAYLASVSLYLPLTLLAMITMIFCRKRRSGHD